MNELVKELKDEIIEALNLEEMTADDIDENEPLFGEGLGLDSIDCFGVDCSFGKEVRYQAGRPC